MRSPLESLSHFSKLSVPDLYKSLKSNSYTLTRPKEKQPSWSCSICTPMEVCGECHLGLHPRDLCLKNLILSSVNHWGLKGKALGPCYQPHLRKCAFYFHWHPFCNSWFKLLTMGPHKPFILQYLHFKNANYYPIKTGNMNCILSVYWSKLNSAVNL